ncbi:MAG: hypothetical protein H7Z18_09505 [Methylophilaceae bacterium]|nr:hypothetical protein [Methylophilaceae bacterium]
MMTPERFKVLVASYGSDLKRWPKDLNDSAVQDSAMRLAQEPEMSLIINNESALDNLLSKHSVLTNNSALADVIFANAFNSLMV